MKTFYLLAVLFLLFGIYKTQAQNAGNALSLDGVDDYASPLTPNVSGQNEGTIEFWFSTAGWNTSTSIWSGGNGHPGVNGDWARIGSHSTTVGNSNLVFGVYAGAWRWSNSGMIPDPAIWRHLAATWNSGGLKVYLDGVLVGSNGYTGGIPNFNTELLGASAWGSFFNGFTDEVRIWNFARSPAQVFSTMLDTLSSYYYTTSDSGLIAYYRMDVLEDLGINSDGIDDLRDLSVNGNHLDTYGDPLLTASGAFIITEVEKTNNETPNQFSLSQNYPNPFNPSTKIKFNIAETGFTSLKIYDLLGNEMSALVNKELQSGSYEFNFDAKGLASGIYFYRLQAGSFIETKKMILIK
jgi:hypothetical protein